MENLNRVIYDGAADMTDAYGQCPHCKQVLTMGHVCNPIYLVTMHNNTELGYCAQPWEDQRNLVAEYADMHSPAVSLEIKP